MHKNRFKQHSLLVITHSYKPLLNPRAFRWTAILEEWAKDGTRIDVITSWQPGQAREEIINNVHVFRVNDSIIEKLRTKFNNSDRKTTATKNKATHKDSTVKKIVKSTLKNLHDFTWKNLYWPDYATLWKKTAIKNAEYLIEHESYDTIISISDPFTSHLVGYALKNKYPNLKWMVDIGDPFCFRHDTPTNNYALYYKKNYKIEKEIFAKADCISVTTETTKQKYAELFPESADKIQVIPPLLPNDTSVPVQNIAENSDTTKLVFVGTLYKNIRNPKYILDLFQNLIENNIQKKIELHFYGSINDCHEVFEPYKTLINTNLFLHGLVDRKTIMKAMSDADILINVGNNNPYQLPSKVVEYASTGKRILNLIQISNDTSAKFFSNYPLCLNLLETKNNSFKQDSILFANFVLNSYDKLTDQFINNYIKLYQVPEITNAYQQLISDQQTQENRPALSVMTPVYNGKDFIERCYYLLCNQTFTNWEWVVVNDGSTDNTEKIIQSFKDPRIKLISYKKNKGRGHARTEALKASTGEWVVVWDVDDIYFPDRLVKINNARLSGFDFCCSYVMLIDNDIQTEQLRGFYPDDSGTTKIFVHPTLGCRLDLAKQIGYDPSLPAGEDAALILSLARKFNGQWIKDILTLYQEVREVNIYKTLSSNYGQLASMKLLFKRGVLDIGYKKYFKMLLKWNIKIMILQLFRLAPSLYLKTVALRKSGETDSDWNLSNERAEFIRQVQKRHNENNWSISQTEKIEIQ